MRANALTCQGTITTDHSLRMRAEEYYPDIMNSKKFCLFEHVGSPPSPPLSHQPEQSGVSAVGLPSKEEQRRWKRKDVYDESLLVFETLRRLGAGGGG